ncbi:MAG: hypothetical protein WC806_03650 [Candidatus Gracilibacteria bacterium]|jgi:hypothetical protein
MTTKPDFSNILGAAHAAAKIAVAAIAHEEGSRGLDCGFAWVVIEGNDPLARFCRREVKAAEKFGTRASSSFGSKGYPSGWQFWCPGEFRGQSVHILEAGARAFRDALATHGIRATVNSRLD